MTKVDELRYIFTVVEKKVKQPNVYSSGVGCQ